MGFEGSIDSHEGDVDDKSTGKLFIASSVSCSICIDVVSDDGQRSWAKLQCGHQFHLDCIGSAFNIKGAMQCPNCRQIEKGQWLFANSIRPFPEFSVDDLSQDEDLYDLGYTEMSFGVHWCPFSGLQRISSSFDEGDFPSSAYQDLIGQHAIIGEHSTISSVTHPCPYIAYFGPVHSSFSNSSGSISDGSNFNNHWNGTSVLSDMSSSYTYPTMDLHYQNWDRHSQSFSTSGTNRINGNDQLSIPSVTQRLSRGNSDVPRPGAFVHPFLASHHGSGARAGTSVPSPIPSYLNSNAQNRERFNSVHAYYQQQPTNSPNMHVPSISVTRRPSRHGTRLGQMGLMSSPDQNGGFYFQGPENLMSNRFSGWRRSHAPTFRTNHVDMDLVRGPFRHNGS